MVSIARISLIAAFGAGVALTGPAFAQGTERATAEVHFGDIDLTSQAGVEQLNRRIAHAADTVCGRPDVRQLKERSAASKCRESALADAAPKVELAVAAARKGESFASNQVSIGVGVRR